MFVVAVGFSNSLGTKLISIVGGAFYAKGLGGFLVFIEPYNWLSWDLSCAVLSFISKL